MLTITVLVMVFSTTNYWRILFHQLISQKSTKNNITMVLDLKTWTNIKKVNDKEIIIDNRFFDIENISYHNELVTIKGHYDDKEKNLREQNTVMQKKGSHCMVFTTFFYLEAMDCLLLGKRNLYSGIVYKPYNFIYVNNLTSIEIPPPKYVNPVA